MGELAFATTGADSSKRTSRQKARAWWLHNLPPLNGPLRFAFYLALAGATIAMMGGHMGVPLEAPEDILSYPSILHMPEGLISVFGTPSVPWLLAIRVLTVVGWACAAVGLFWRLSAIVTGLGYFVLSGVSYSLSISHAPLLPSFALLALCLSSCDDPWTVDTHIARRWPGYWFRPAPIGSVSRTGFPRTLVGLAAVFTMFSPGIAKLRDGGLAWLDGSTILTFTTWIYEDHRSRFLWFAGLLVAHPKLCSLGAVVALVVELGGPVAWFSRRLRHLWIAGAVFLHLGILSVLGPDFAPYIATYVLIVDWRRLFRLRTPAAPADVAPASGPPLWPAALGSATVATFLVVIGLRIEAWPLSFLPMYASYLSQSRVGDLPADTFKDAEGVQRVAIPCAQGVYGPWLGHCKWIYPIVIAERTGLRLAGDTTCQARISLKKDIGGEGLMWNRKLGYVAIHALAEKPLGRIGETPDADGEGKRFVQDLAPLLANKAAANPGCTRVEMTYELANGPVVLASASLVAADGAGAATHVARNRANRDAP